MNKNFADLTSAELAELRSEIVLNSLFISDYDNSFGYDQNHICTFFEGYVSYLEELAEEDGYTEWDNIFKMFDIYDTEDNLYSWFMCSDDLSWVKFECGFNIGDKVKWEDPAIDDYDEEDRENLLDRIFEIYSINGEVITITEVGGGSEAEVYANELSLA
jgi:hypothetical protein